MVTVFFILLGILLLLIFKGQSTLHERLFPRLYTSVDFPERWFPAKDSDRFSQQVQQGYQQMKNVSVIICGITRDDADVLWLTLQRIQRLGSYFKAYTVVIYENDSCDHTLELLTTWAATHPEYIIVHESLQQTPILNLRRCDRLAYCRNQYLHYLKHSLKCDDYQYVIVVDMDLKGGWSYDGIASSFSDTQWDVMISNSLGYHSLRKTYYDMYTLSPRAILQENLVTTLLGSAWYLRRGMPLIPVESGFGGLSIYTKETILAGEYAGRLQGEKICEHQALTLHRELRCYLNPSQITVVGTQRSLSEKHALHSSDWLIRAKMRLKRILRNW
jgi:hypothetical protein